MLKILKEIQVAKNSLKFQGEIFAVIKILYCKGKGFCV